MNNDEELIRLRRQNSELRSNLSDAHDQVGRITYKFGYVMAMLNIPADLPFEEVMKRVGELRK